jgi:esterase/lipase
MMLVCIHGNSLDASVFNEINIPGIQKIAVNLPGHGTKALSSETTFADFVEDVYQEIKDLEDVVLLGLSLGGHIAHHLVEKMNPLAVVTFGAPPLNVQNVSKAFGLNPLGQLLFGGEISKSQALELANSMLPLNKKYVNDLAKLITSTNTRAREVLSQSLMKGEFQDEVKLLTNYKGKKIIVIPRHDTFINHEYIRSLGICQVVELDGGHALSWDNSQGLNDLLSRELANLR